MAREDGVSMARAVVCQWHEQIAFQRHQWIAPNWHDMLEYILKQERLTSQWHDRMASKWHERLTSRWHGWLMSKLVSQRL